MKKWLASLVGAVVFSGVVTPDVHAESDDYRAVDLRKESNITAEEIDEFIEEKTDNDSPLIGHGEDFIEAEEEYGVNAKYLAAHAMLESNYGRSKLAVNKNNLFGLGAYGKDPYENAKKFASYEECIEYLAEYVRESYLEKDGKYYNGSNLIGMNKRYASDKKWSSKIANLMENMKAFDVNHYEAQEIMPMATK